MRENVTMAIEHTEWRLQSGQYLGEISALCFLPHRHLMSSPFLLAGTGSQILVYDILAGKLLKSFHVFEGIRVHGISCSFLDFTEDRASAKLPFKIVVYGERRVKLFSLYIDTISDHKNSAKTCVELMQIQAFPNFSHWVLDVCFLKLEEDMLCENYGHLAVGLSNNSICLSDISKPDLLLEVKCPERCLLYSMRLWGDNINMLRVASGTIYNQIIVWKVVAKESNLISTNSAKEVNQPDSDNSCCKSGHLHDQQYTAILFSRLIGHEGSIFRMAWSSDGSKLISVSDDRSARLWTDSARKKDSGDMKEVLGTDISVGLVLFGHNARIWDCYISDSIIVTAGEDCTCRVWGMDGEQLLLIKEHIGRGIWRCLYDPYSSLLVTAGFDSTIKAHSVHTTAIKDRMGQDGVVEDFKERTEIFRICTPRLSGQLGLMDSKSEYVRSLHFAREDILYVATNNGYVYHIRLFGSDNVKWTELVRVGEEVPIICMDLLSIKTSDRSVDMEDWLAIGDGKGNATIVRVINIDSSLEVGFSFSWSAEKERQLLGIYWCKSLGCRHLVTVDPRGKLKLWLLNHILHPISDNSTVGLEPSLIGVFTSCFGTRIMCLDASFEEEVLVCGDQRGNLIVFILLKDLLVSYGIGSEEINPVTYFKGAHGISGVASILIVTSTLHQVEICSTGGDGCICYFKYDRDWQSFEFMGMKQVKELSLVQSVFASASFAEDLAQGNYAIGFASTDFIIWDLINESKILAIPCGGWRRPHSHFLGSRPDFQSCFAYLKDHTIHIHRLWVPASERRLLPQVLHMQFHGREIHSLCFVSVGLQLNPYESSDHFLRFSWIATGCEDGTVRLTRYTSETESWSASRMLGENVGGSAVRAICFISTIYTSLIGLVGSANGRDQHSTTSESRDQLLLISVGAKQVLTSWLLQSRRYQQEAVPEGAQNSENLSNRSSKGCSSMSFQWLSTHMPPRFASTRKSIENKDKHIGQERNISDVKKSPPSGLCSVKEKETHNEPSSMEQIDNDWRYLAVTAFLVKNADYRLTVCFVAVACSDATLTLRALLLPSRLWFDVALLVPQTSPVLALQHVVVPICAPSPDKAPMGNTYIVISGSTDGSITFWDLTKTVEHFMQHLSIIQPEKHIDCQRRPRTGRGSQGGRWWKSLTHQSPIPGPRDATDTSNINEDINGQIVDSAGSVSVLNKTVSFPLAEINTDNSLDKIHELQPLHVISTVHKSGVNCLHVSKIEAHQHSESESLFSVLSGGDDQAVHCLVFALDVQLKNHDYCCGRCSDFRNDKMALPLIHPAGMTSMGMCSRCSGIGYSIRFLHQHKIASAHSSAVKGVWTDGTWVFSTGLDQRVRCWHLNECGALAEYAHLIISVPEPETLDARACGRNQYQIAVAGRGMQMVDFSVS